MCVCVCVCVCVCACEAMRACMRVAQALRGPRPAFRQMQSLACRVAVAPARQRRGSHSDGLDGVLKSFSGHPCANQAPRHRSRSRTRSIATVVAGDDTCDSSPATVAIGYMLRRMFQRIPSKARCSRDMHGVGDLYSFIELPLLGPAHTGCNCRSMGRAKRTLWQL